MDSENSLRAKHLARLYVRFLRASQKHDHYHIAAYADDPRLQDLLECRVHLHSWDAFDLSGQEFSDWFEKESNSLWIRIGRQTDLPIEPTDLDIGPPTLGPPTHAVQMPDNPWFGGFVPQLGWRILGGESTFRNLVLPAALASAGLSDDPTDPTDPTGCWLGILYRLFPDQRSMLVFDQPHAASAFLPAGDKIKIAWLPWNVFRASAKAIKKLLQQDSLSVEPAATDDGTGSSEGTVDSNMDEKGRLSSGTPETQHVDGKVDVKPSWNRELAKLRLGDQVIRRVRSVTVAKNVVKILDAFEEEGWPARIDDPLDPSKDQQRLHEALKRLNGGLTGIHFRADGSGQGILWDRV